MLSASLVLSLPLFALLVLFPSLPPPLPPPLSLSPGYRLLWYAQAAVKREPLAIWGDVGKNAEEQDVLRSLKEAFEVEKPIHVLTLKAHSHDPCVNAH